MAKGLIMPVSLISSDRAIRSRRPASAAGVGHLHSARLNALLGEAQVTEQRANSSSEQGV